MSERSYILDPKGRRIPLLDGHGNLSAEAMALYVGDDLSTEDRSLVDAVANADELTREALEGLKTLAVNHRAAFTALNAEIAERTGTDTVVHTLQPDIPWMRIAAGVALLLCIGGVTYLAYQWNSEQQLASNDTTETHEVRSFDVTDAEPDNEPVTEPQTSSPVEVEELPAKEVEQEEMATVTVPPKVTEQPKAEEKKAPEKPVKPEVKPVKDEPKAEKKEDPGAKVPDAVTNAKKATTPPAAALMASNGNEQAASGAAAETIAKQETAAAPQPSTLDGTTSARQAAKRELQTMAQVDAEAEARNNQEKPLPFDRADAPPKFPGGDVEMGRFISKNKNYPQALATDGVSGAVYVNFVIEKDGRVSNAKVVQGVHANLDEDAARVIRAMPRWTPAEKDGQKVRTTRTVIVKYE